MSCSVQLKTRSIAKSKKVNNVIHRTTSETIRLGEPDSLVNNTSRQVISALAISPPPLNKSACSFQITGVAQRTDIGGDDSADDLDESRTDDISRITDNETPSFSEDTCSREVDDNFVTSCNAVCSITVIPSSSHYELAFVPSDKCLDVETSIYAENSINILERSKGTALGSTMEGQSKKSTPVTSGDTISTEGKGSDVSIPTSVSTAIDGSSQITGTALSSSPSMTRLDEREVSLTGDIKIKGTRFQVVKVPSNEILVSPRSRWESVSYEDQSKNIPTNYPSRETKSVKPSKPSKPSKHSKQSKRTPHLNIDKIPMPCVNVFDTGYSIPISGTQMTYSPPIHQLYPGTLTPPTVTPQRFMPKPEGTVAPSLHTVPSQSMMSAGSPTENSSGPYIYHIPQGSSPESPIASLFCSPVRNLQINEAGTERSVFVSPPPDVSVQHQMLSPPSSPIKYVPMQQGYLPQYSTSTSLSGIPMGIMPIQQNSQFVQDQKNYVGQNSLQRSQTMGPLNVTIPYQQQIGAIPQNMYSIQQPTSGNIAGVLPRPTDGPSAAALGTQAGFAQYYGTGSGLLPTQTAVPMYSGQPTGPLPTQTTSALQYSHTGRLVGQNVTPQHVGPAPTGLLPNQATSAVQYSPTSQLSGQNVTPQYVGPAPTGLLPNQTTTAVQYSPSGHLLGQNVTPQYVGPASTGLLPNQATSAVQYSPSGHLLGQNVTPQYVRPASTGLLPNQATSDVQYSPSGQLVGQNVTPQYGGPAPTGLLPNQTTSAVQYSPSGHLLGQNVTPQYVRPASTGLLPNQATSDVQYSPSGQLVGQNVTPQYGGPAPTGLLPNQTTSGVQYSPSGQLLGQNVTPQYVGPAPTGLLPNQATSGVQYSRSGQLLGQNVTPQYVGPAPTGLLPNPTTSGVQYSRSAQLLGQNVTPQYVGPAPTGLLPNPTTSAVQYSPSGQLLDQNLTSQYVGPAPTGLLPNQATSAVQYSPSGQLLGQSVTQQYVGPAPTGLLPNQATSAVQYSPSGQLLDQNVTPQYVGPAPTGLLPNPTTSAVQYSPSGQLLDQNVTPQYVGPAPTGLLPNQATSAVQYSPSGQLLDQNVTPQYVGPAPTGLLPNQATSAVQYSPSGQLLDQNVTPQYVGPAPTGLLPNQATAMQYSEPPTSLSSNQIKTPQYSEAPTGPFSEPTAIVQDSKQLLENTASQQSLVASNKTSDPTFRSPTPIVKGDVQVKKISSPLASSTPTSTIVETPEVTSMVNDPVYTQACTSQSAIIDNKIEQAMDLVKSHLMYTVREEVEVLKVRISELLARINQLETENNFLKANASPEVLNALNKRATVAEQHGDKSVPKKNEEAAKK